MSWLSFAFAILISVYVAYSYYEMTQLSQEHKLEKFIAADLETLRSHRVLPASFDSVSHLEVQTGTEQARKWLEKIKLPIEQKQDGEFKLEVLLMSFEDDDGKTAAIIQYNIVNNKTHDMVWELGRTFYLNP